MKFSCWCHWRYLDGYLLKKKWINHFMPPLDFPSLVTHFFSSHETEEHSILWHNVSGNINQNISFPHSSCESLAHRQLISRELTIPVRVSSWLFMLPRVSQTLLKSPMQMLGSWVVPQDYKALRKALQIWLSWSFLEFSMMFIYFFTWLSSFSFESLISPKCHSSHHLSSKLHKWWLKTGVLEMQKIYVTSILLLCYLSCLCGFIQIAYLLWTSVFSDIRWR